MNMNTKIAQPTSEDGRKTSAPASMILLPDGILDLSDELSNDGDDLLEEDASELKLKRSSEANADGNDNKAAKPDDGQRAKLRIKTGGNLMRKYFSHRVCEYDDLLKKKLLKIPVRKTNDERLIGSMLGEDGESDFDSSLEYIHPEGDSDDSEINLENDPAANVEALYNFSENVPARVKSAKPKTNQSDEDF